MLSKKDTPFSFQIYFIHLLRERTQDRTKITYSNRIRVGGVVGEGGGGNVGDLG